ncbi:penicillin acylase family protein [Pedobacter sp. BS3]|uniref:penicillin acylase family protein n=1 Tax=Pedobacter sp. BS3 TaxID=2567937 RepID=UPI0011ED69BA|nr:penicillin acylase family protein [Pedobacter sp. BS3]TZF82571.1 penicillin acylase family protein [Pedobacter sp. BS3]
MKYAKAIGLSAFVIAFTIILNTKLGDIPPLGKFLNPFRGFWKNAEKINRFSLQDMALDSLRSPVSITFDEHRIPHIFAQNDDDLYFIQGYLTARDRLWQMDFQTRFAAGRLSEVVGAKALELDRYQRRMGMGYGAENMVKQLDNDPEQKRVLQRYADGVNAYINQLKPGDYPIEFKLLDYKPEKWEIINSALLLKLMSATLAGGSDEFYMSNILKKYGPEITSDLFPDFYYKSNPVIPAGTTWNFKPVAIPEIPDTYTAFNSTITTKQHESGIGSNNWALSGNKTASGHPLLANDPHLNLTLPAIWYQVQLSSPGMNVYGVSIPGSPGVIIGFNQHIAWGVTNVYADVLDWYSVKFKDNQHKQYWYNNQWNTIKQRIETIRVRGGKTVSDTVLYTHQGPVVYLENQKPGNFSKAANVPQGYALRWIAHDPSSDIKTFYLLNRAKNYDDYRKALTCFTAPAQNFIFASTNNDIAITPNGYFPLKWKDQGKFLLDGSNPQNDWHGRIPADQNPTVKNPPQGYLVSANQPSTDSTYPYYVNWEFSLNERAERLNARLSAMSNATVDSMRNLQNDNYSMLADEILPTLLSYLNRDNLSATEGECLYLMKNWNKRYNADEKAASIFEIWQQNLSKEIWDDDFGDTKFPMRYPSQDRTVQLILHEPDSRWFDNVKTPQKETLKDLVDKSFRYAVDSLVRGFGPVSYQWQWGNVRSRRVNHLAKIAGFGSRILHIGGAKGAVNALGPESGPSWRMVVDLSNPVKAYGIIPGGQSGNPGSFYYDDMLTIWSTGNLDSLHFLISPVTDKKFHTVKFSNR